MFLLGSSLAQPYPHKWLTNGRFMVLSYSFKCVFSVTYRYDFLDDVLELLSLYSDIIVLFHLTATENYVKRVGSESSAIRYYS